jgi:hypothetical protein
MTPEERRQAEFWARLVSVTDWQRAREGERLLLQEDLDTLRRDQDIAALHKEARSLVMSLLRGGRHSLPFKAMLWQEGGRVRQGIAVDRPSLAALADLVRLVAAGATFGQCPQCHRIFVTTSTKKFCSPSCQVQANAGKRDRAAYMRTYMAKRRAEEKEKELVEVKRRALARKKAGKLPAGEKEFAEDLKSLPLSPWKTDEERKTYQAAEQQRLREILEKKRQTTAPQGRKEK